MLFGFYVISLALFIFQLTIKDKFTEVHKTIGSNVFIVLSAIDFMLNLISQSIILYYFYSNFRFFRDKYTKNAGHTSMPCNLKLLTAWIMLLVLQIIFDFALRMLSRIITIHGLESLNLDWAKDFWIPYLQLFSPYENFCELLTYCILVIAMSQPTITN